MGVFHFFKSGVQKMPSKGLRWKSAVILILPFPILIASLFIGTYQVPPQSILAIIFSPITHANIPEVYRLVIIDIRLPRIILALVGGLALSVSGGSLQSLFRNPLVDSYVLGVSAGAGFGAALAIAFVPNSPWIVQAFAFFFGFVSFLLTYSVARNRGEVPVVSLVLGGIIVTALFTAGLSMIKFFTSPEQLASIVYWLMGSLSLASWNVVLQVLPLVLLGFLFVFLMRWRLNVLSMGDEEAKALGVNVERDRFIILLVTTLMVSALVAVTGIIGWIGLIVPHIVRMFVRTSDNRVVIPLSAALGAIFLLLADDFARSLTTFELPVGLITTLIGAPFFLYLLKRSGGLGWK
jgi:iron complex transport system permease protein